MKWFSPPVDTPREKKWHIGGNSDLARRASEGLDWEDHLSTAELCRTMKALDTTRSSPPPFRRKSLLLWVLRCISRVSPVKPRREAERSERSASSRGSTVAAPTGQLGRGVSSSRHFALSTNSGVTINTMSRSFSVE